MQWDFDSQSVLVAKRWGRHLVGAHYDEFEIDFQNPFAWPGGETGKAWAVAYSYDTGEHWRFALEWLRVESDVPARTVYLGETAFAIESKLELSVRYALSGNF